MHNFYATDPKNIVNFEIGNKSTTCGPAATKTSKVTDTLICIYVCTTPPKRLNLEQNVTLAETSK